MITIRDATQEDLDYVRQNSIELSVKNYSELKLSGFAKTCIFNNEIIGIGGVILLREGLGEAWMIATPQENTELNMESVLCIKEIIQNAFDSLSLRRLQAIVKTDFLRGKKLVEILGFVCEGILRKYLPDGSDCYIYARVI